MDDLNKKNLRLGLVLGGVALLMFVLMVVWASHYMNLPI